MIRASIRRPIAVTMVYGALAALGAFAWRDLPVDLIPDVRLPRLTVAGAWGGASPETVEAFLTSPLEAAIQQVRGVETVVSTSTEGGALVQVDFERGVDMDFARLELSERIAALEDDLPAGAGGVRVQPWVPDELRAGTWPLLSYDVTGPHTLEALRAHVEDVVRPALAGLEGVALVRVMGGRARRIEIRVDPETTRSLGLSPDLLRARVAELDLVREAGIIREADRDRTVTIVSRPESASDLQDAVVATIGEAPVRLRDVARVRDGYEEPVEHRRVDGRAAVTVEVIEEMGAHAAAVADRVKAAVSRLQQLAPYGYRYVLLADESEPIRSQLSWLGARAAGSALVVFVVALVALRSLASAGVIAAALALSVLVTLVLVRLAGLSLDLFTVTGLAMGFGLLVDNCVVVVESVHARRRGGEAAALAAERGTRAVARPILASTATHLIVFVPFVYLQGEMRAFYVPLAVAVGLSQVASLLVGFSFVPALAARVAVRAEPGAAPRPPRHARSYAALVAWTLRRPWSTVSAAVALLAGSAWLFDRHVHRGRGWSGPEGTDTQLEVEIALPRGSELERADELVRWFEERIARLPGVARFTAWTRSETGSIRITFPDSLAGTRVPLEARERLVALGHGFTGAEIRVHGSGPSFQGGDASPPTYTVTVLGYDYEGVREIARDLGARLARVPRVGEVNTNAAGPLGGDRAAEWALRIDREGLARHELTATELVAELQAAIGNGSAVRTLELGGAQVRYDVRLEGSEDVDGSVLLETPIATGDGRRVPLGEVASLERREVPANILRRDQRYRRQVTFEFRGPVRVGRAVLDALLAHTEVPPGYTVTAEGGYFLSRDERGQIALVLGVSLLLVYMVTAAAFESLLRPLCVLLTVPMGLIGIFLVFLVTRATFTREASVGAITTAGIVVSNAILLVDQLDRTRRESGLSFRDAVVSGALARARPILVTSATTVLSLAPLVLLGDPDAGVGTALGLTLMGGMVSSTLLVLVVTPALYALLAPPRPGEREPGSSFPAQGSAIFGVPFAQP